MGNKNPPYFQEMCDCARGLYESGARFAANVSNGMLSDLHPREAYAQGKSQEQSRNIS